MTERRCIELTAVYDDGTVERWEGEHLVSISDSGRWSEEFIAGDGTKRGAPTTTPTTTKPLRRVTVVRGRHAWAGNDWLTCESPECCLALDLYMVPDGADRRDVHSMGPLCDWRITVEAVPVRDYA